MNNKYMANISIVSPASVCNIRVFELRYIINLTKSISNIINVSYLHERGEGRREDITNTKYTNIAEVVTTYKCIPCIIPLRELMLKFN